MIPVLILPVVGDFDHAERMLASIDVRVGRLVIVDNSLTGWRSQTRDDAAYIRPVLGLGYPGGINAGIMQTPDAPWWLFCSADLVFAPGDLAHIAETMHAATGPRVVTGSHRGLRWVYGAVNVATIERVGIMDAHTFFPIYFDDDDYEYRARLAGVEWLHHDGGMRHAGSQTIKDPDHGAANGRTFPLNRAAYLAKWGGLPGDERFRTPWNVPGLPLWATRPDPAGRARRLW